VSDLRAKTGVMLLACSGVLVLWGTYLWGFNPKFDPTRATTDPTGVVCLVVAGTISAVVAAWMWRTKRPFGPWAVVTVILAALALLWVLTKGANSGWVILDLCEALALGGAGRGFQANNRPLTTYCGSAGISLLLSDMWLNLLQSRDSGMLVSLALGAGAELVAAGLCGYAIWASRGVARDSERRTL
jgi:hypothetical protein